MLEIAPGGLLTVDDDYDSRLSVGNIDVSGAFAIGSQAKPYAKKAVFEITCGSPFFGPDDRRKAVVVRANGTLALFGAKGASSQTWTKLLDTAYAGSTCISLDLPSGWEVGDEIVLPSTDFDPHQAERRTIVTITPTCVEINAPLTYMHYGRVTEGVDERGEAGLLTRSITFHGCEETTDLTPDVGAHMIFLEDFRQVQVQGVELQNFGQGDQLGRYPMHFHLCGQVPSGTFLRFNAIHNSNFRAIAIHGSQGVRLEGNVAFNITGHAIMLEDGAESGNVIRGNLIVLVKEKLTHVRLGSDAQVALSAFYITNPGNTITDNVVAGVEGSAFWIHTRLEVKGQSYLTGKYNGIHPFKIPLGDMRRNVAHSVEVAFKIDSPDLDALDYPQQRYSPPYTYKPDAMPVISDFLVHHSRQGGWFRSLRIVLDKWIVGDVTEGVQILSRGDTSMESVETYVTNSLFVGGTANRGTLVSTQWQFVNYLENRSDSAVDRTDDARMAIKLYDGPMFLSNCTFKLWYSQPCLNVINPAIGARLYNAFLMSTTIIASDLVFEKTDVKLHVGDREADGGKTTSMVDKLGTVSGIPGAILLPDWDFYMATNCVRNVVWGLACPQRYANLDIVSIDTSTDPTRFGKIKIYRNNVATLSASPIPSLTFTGQYIPASSGWLYHPIVSPDALYTIQFEHHTPEQLKLVFSNTKINEVFNVVIAYPATTQLAAVLDQNGRSLAEISSAKDSSCVNCYWFDSASSLLRITVQEHAEAASPDYSCSPSGCLTVTIQSSLPTDSSVSDAQVAGLAPLLTSGIDDAWLAKRFSSEIAVFDAADNMDWCEIDDPCLHSMDEGNVKMGILAYFDDHCVGVGCFSSTCRYCKLTFSVAKVPFPPCPFDPNYSGITATATSACAAYASEGNSAAGVEVVEDSSCVNGGGDNGAGCIDDQCRYCKSRESVQSSSFLSCSQFAVPSVSSSPSSSSAKNSVSPAPSLTTDALTTTSPGQIAPSTGNSSGVCASLVAEGDRVAGISAIEDAACAYGGLGCFSLNCRFCKTAETRESSQLLPCSQTPNTAVTSVNQVATTGGILDLCWLSISPGDIANGLTAITDSLCAYGGLGCLSPSCRFCRVRETPLSEPYMSCDDVEAAIRDYGTHTASVPPTDPCTGLVSSGDVAVGITALTQTSCGTAGGVGCVTDSCQYCKTRTTKQSAHLLNCTSLTLHTSTADRLLQETLSMAASSSPIVASIDVCSHAISIEENVAGIFGFTDFSCGHEGGNQVGCFMDSCRYCRTDDAVDVYSEDHDSGANDSVDDFVLCPAYVVSSSMGRGPHHDRSALGCEANVSFGDSQSGISAFPDAGCLIKSEAGCFARRPCRYCKYRETLRSASFAACPSASDTSSSLPSPLCSELPALLNLSNVSATDESRCSTGASNLTGCIAFTSCRLCRPSNASVHTAMVGLPYCSDLDDTTAASLTIRLAADQPDQSPSSTSSSSSDSDLTWRPIIECVVGAACVVAAVTIFVHKMRRRGARDRNRHARLVTPRRLPRADDGHRVSVAALPADSDFFVL